jgi:hypothetical protein
VTRPPLNRVPLESVDLLRPGQVTVTMSAGQWGALLAAAYAQGGLLLELDDEEFPVAAYRRPVERSGPAPN